MPRDWAQSSTPPTSAPDCDRKARRPGNGCAEPKLALMPSAGTHTPRQFGPMMRRQVGRAASSIACLVALSRPAVITTAAGVPLAPSSAIRGGTVSGGVTITASSGAAGSAATLAKHSRPATSLCCGLTR